MICSPFSHQLVFFAAVYRVIMDTPILQSIASYRTQYCYAVFNCLLLLKRWNLSINVSLYCKHWLRFEWMFECSPNLYSGDSELALKLMSFLEASYQIKKFGSKTLTIIILIKSFIRGNCHTFTAEVFFFLLQSHLSGP